MQPPTPLPRFTRGPALTLFLVPAILTGLAWTAHAIDELGGGGHSAADPALSLARAASVAALQCDGWKRKVWTLYPVEKVRADQALPTLKGGLELDAARGESEPFVVVIRSDVPLREVRVQASALVDGNGRKLVDAVQIRRIGYVHVDEPSGTRMKAELPYETGRGEIPDPLLQLPAVGPGGAEARPQRNLQFLVTARIPRDAAPGLYRGELEIGFRREPWWPAAESCGDRIPFGLRVRSFALPERSPLLNTSVVSTARLPEWLQRPDVLEGLKRELGDHYQTPDPLPSPKVSVSKEGALDVDSTAWEAAVDELFAGGRASHVFLPTWSPTRSGEMQGLYFLWHYPAVTSQRWVGERICRENGDLEPGFEERYGAYLRHMHGVLQRRGWLDRVFVATMDEPYTYHTGDRARDTPENNYRVIANFVRLVRREAPGLKTFATANPAPGLNGWIDHWCLRNPDAAREALERARTFGETVTFCDNYRTFVDYPAVAARSLGWLAWKIGARGWLTYETLGSFTEAWEGPVFVYPQFGGSTVWGMGQLFYPDPAGRGSVAPSLRWELMREGAEDYLYLDLLRKKLDAGGFPEALRPGVRTLLDSAASAVVGGAGDAETVSGRRAPNAQDQSVPHRIRREIADLLEQQSP